MPTPPTASTAEADLAFMRSLVDGGRQPVIMVGPSVYLVAGLLYGLLCIFHLVDLLTPIDWPGSVSLAVTLGINIAFFGWLIVVLVRERGRKIGGSAGARALNAMFNATGLANLGFLIVLGLNATWRHDLGFWLLYGSIVFIIQGAAWHVAFLMRRAAWMGWTAAGWFAGGIALGLTLDKHLTAYLAICAAGLLLCMALPGWIMIRQARAAAAAER